MTSRRSAVVGRPSDRPIRSAYFESHYSHHKPPVVIDKDVEEGVDNEVDEDVTGDEPSLPSRFFATKS
ncbi:hypothetical protein MUK60_18445 [Streptomyces sp. LRE541]|uniref:hypothetical protein n=1 Tax=Streptomyces sp. LRE541 TaxID=2931983 RepID=UPI00200E24BB|nr:hypothetical protein [Streptomyces sp. LRE541]UPZ29602.1 hypothetical protein MUK60_18445 [Streptomyces sp. LRE541]